MKLLEIIKNKQKYTVNVKLTNDLKPLYTGLLNDVPFSSGIDYDTIRETVLSAVSIQAEAKEVSTHLH